MAFMAVIMGFRAIILHTFGVLVLGPASVSRRSKSRKSPSKPDGPGLALPSSGCRV